MALTGPIAAFFQLESDCDTLLELDGDANGQRFAALRELRDFAKRVKADWSATWKRLDQIDAGELPVKPTVETPKPETEMTGGEKKTDGDNANNDGAPKGDGPSRGRLPKKGK